jgi:hypothetical protein
LLSEIGVLSPGHANPTKQIREAVATLGGPFTTAIAAKKGHGPLLLH